MSNQSNKRTLMRTYRVELIKETSKLYDLPSKGIIRSPHDAYDIFKKVLNYERMSREHLMLATLNTKNKVTGLHIVHVGTLNSSVVHPRDVFQHALLDNASSIILAHNHPSGDTTPSQEDVQVTKRMEEVANILGIKLLDHIILGDGHTSLREVGDL